MAKADLKTIQKFQSLPQDVQEYLLSPEVVNEFQKIASKHNLTAEQKSKSLDLIRNIVLGLEEVEEFNEELLEMDVDQAKVASLIGDLFNLYFIPLESKYNLGASSFLKKINQPVRSILDLASTVKKVRGVEEEEKNRILETEVGGLSETFSKFLQLPEVKQILEQVEEIRNQNLVNE